MPGSDALSEQARLAALHSYAVLDTPAEEAFDDIVQLAAQLCDTPIAILSFVDAQRQWFKAAVGVDVREVDRAQTLCEPVLHSGQPLWAPDTLQHPLLASHPLVRGAPGIRFYACIPLVNGQGLVLGTLATMDTQPHPPQPSAWSALQRLARQTMAQLELRRQSGVLTQLLKEHADMQVALQQQADQLRLSEERFHFGARATAHAVWDWDLRTHVLWWNEGLEQLLGTSLSSVPNNHAWWLQRIHPEESAAVQQSLQAALESGASSWSAQYRFCCRDGHYMWVQDRGFILRDAQGKAQRMVGGMSDLRAQKEIEAHARQEARIHADLVQLQQKTSSMDMDLSQALTLVAETALHTHQAGGAMVELLEGEQLVSHACAGPLARQEGTVLSVHQSMVWESLVQGRAVLCNDTLAQGWDLGQGRQHMRAVVAVPLRVQQTVVGLLKVVSSQPNAFTNHDLAHLQFLAESLSAMVQLRKVTAQLQASEQQYRQLFEAHPQPMWVYAQEGRQRLLAANRAMRDLYGYSAAEALQLHMHDLQKAGASPVLPDPQCDAVLHRHQRKDGTPLEVEISVRSIHFDTLPACQVIALDVTGQRQAAHALARLAKAQQMLSACNETLVRATSEASLLQDICHIAVEMGGYRIAWIGLVQDEATPAIMPVACAGCPDEDALQHLCHAWFSALPDGHQPAGMALRTGHSVLVRDLQRHLAPDSGQAQLQARGIQDGICLPLRHQQRNLGVLCLYACEALDIDSQENRLLQELADDLAFGIEGLRTRQEQQRLHSAVAKVAAAVSVTSDTEFFVQLAHSMAEALDAQVGCIGLLCPPRSDGTVYAQSLAVVIHGVLQPNACHDLSGTPSLQLLTQPQLVIERNVLQQYPQAPVIGQLNAQSYAGQQLCDASGQPIGAIFVLFRQPMANPAFVTSALQIFATRASAELQRQRADARIRRQASLLDKAQDAIIVRDLHQRILFWNHSAERMYGWTSAQALGQSCATLLYGDPTGCEHATAAVLEQGEWVGELLQKHRDGHSIEMEGRWTLVRSDDGQAESILSINTDITARKATEREIQRLAFYDALTGLPNRLLLMDRMRQALATSQRTHNGGALLFIDMDNFKTLNDTLGHDKGDLMLQQVGQRLKTCVRDIDTVARLGGDEFVVMLEALSAQPEELAVQARHVGEKILAALSSGYQLGAYLYRSTPSIGIAPFQGQDANVGELLQQADLAMYQAKAAGRNTLRFFNPQMQAVVNARADLEADLRTALAQHQFSLHYQPQVNQQGQCMGVEALLRWQHPERGVVLPKQFIALAEETGLILMLGRWVLHTACELLARWRHDPALCHLTMAVNVSSRQFRSASFIHDVERVLAITQAPAQLLQLELTESVLVEDMEATIASMVALRDLGVCLALDDFGTGYSSLAYLKRMPLCQLKIDQGFVRDLLTDPSDAVIVQAILGLSHNLGLDVIAEGVETAEQHAALLQAGCPAFQGNLFSLPLPVQPLEVLLHQGFSPPPASTP